MMRSQLLVLGVALLVPHGGPPLEVSPTDRRGAGEAPAPLGADVDAARFLAAAHGADPVICSLAATPLGNRWGGGAPPAPGDAAALVEWALQPSIDDRDLTVLEAGLRDADGCVRAMAARLLAAAPTGPRILMRALGDDRPDTRRAAAEGLGYAEDRSATGALIRRIEDDDAGVRAAAAWALGRIEDPTAESALGAALRDTAPSVRLAAIHALGELELQSSLELLLPMLLDDDPRARAATARALGAMH